MEVWLFAGADPKYALSCERDGANLPTDRGPWRLIRSATLCSDMPDEKRAIELITEYGFCCFD